MLLYDPDPGDPDPEEPKIPRELLIYLAEPLTGHDACNWLSDWERPPLWVSMSLGPNGLQLERLDDGN